LLGPQLPPMLKPAALQIRSGAPPAIDTLCSAPSAKNPTQWPYGEKNGCLAPEVPAIGFGSSSLNFEVDPRGSKKSLYHGAFPTVDENYGINVSANERLSRLRRGKSQQRERFFSIL